MNVSEKLWNKSETYCNIQRWLDVSKKFDVSKMCWIYSRTIG